MESNNNEFIDKFTNSFEINNQGKEKIKQILSISHDQEDFSSSEENEIPQANALNHTMRQEDQVQKNIFDHDITINYQKNRHKNLPYKKRPSKIFKKLKN